MIGYLVLVPADQQPAVAAAAAAAAQRIVPQPVETPASAGPVRIDTVQRTAAVDGNTLDLTFLEFELLAHLVAHPHRVHTRDQLVTTVWGYGHVGDGRTVDVHIARLRRKLGVEHRRSIQTVRRVGYKYAP
jgi:DNA-binding response OmpR family regulator